MPSLYEQQYSECRALYEQDKFEECIRLGESNLTEPGLSQYLRVKTLCMLAGAAEEWGEAEDWRLNAERLYRSRYSHIQQKKASLLDDPSLYAPENYPIWGARYPLREGSVKDVIAWRKWRQEQSSDEEDQDQDPMEDVVINDGEMEEDAEFEADDDDIPLEDAAKVQVAKEEVFGKDVNIIDAMAKATLGEEGASEQMAAKDSETCLST